MTSLSTLSPAPLWQWFEQICAIPHPSKHEQQLIDHILNWAKDKPFSVSQDTVGNLIFKKPAVAGYEDRKTVVLQAHLDMVPQKNSDKQHDFTTDPIETIIDGEWLRANGTTLGSDNGIGMASALAVLGSTDIAHGPLEVLLTVDEEAGMTGAFGLEKGTLDAQILINTDSEQEGEIYMGCAGGVDAKLTLPISKNNSQLPLGMTINVKGLKGGHSGCDIHLGRANANKLLAEVLLSIQHYKAELTEFTGGSLRNAIPREASAQLNVAPEQLDAIKQTILRTTQALCAQYAIAEPTLSIELSDGQANPHSFDSASQSRLLQLINVCPNGVVAMSQEIDGVVETSLNLGVIRTQDSHVELLCLIRSLDDIGRQRVQDSLSNLAKLAQCEVEFDGAYPGWKPDPSSPIMAIVRETYQELYQKTPNIMVIHAGLECGLFKEPYPEMDMVSIGPTIRFPHSPDEKVHIGSVDLYWQLLLALLKQIPTKD